MKIFLLLLAFALPLHAEECFSVDPGRILTEDSCGNVDAKISVSDCLTGEVHKNFSATMGFDCSESPPKLKLLYNGRMLVAEYSSFDQHPDFKVMKTYILDLTRTPSEVAPQAFRGKSCFTMKPLEKINPSTCDPVRTQIQFASCTTHTALGKKFEVTAHYTCGEHQSLKYWYKKMMLVGTLKRTNSGLQVSQTFSIVYPSIYGVFNDRSTSSVKN
jgi:hypothetical protein